MTDGQFTPNDHDPVECDKCDTQAPECRHTLSDDDRAAQMERYIEDLCKASGKDRDEIRVFKTQKGEKELKVFELGSGFFESEEVRYYEYTADEAIEAIRQGASGFGIYLGRESCGTDGVGVMDNDDADGWPYDATPSEYKLLSGSGGGYHHPFVHDGSVSNANSKKETPYEGSVRTENYYHLLPGSIHPSGGVYTIAHRTEIPEATEDDFPEDLKPRKNTIRDLDGSKVQVPKEVPDDDEVGEFTNEIGWSLDTVREKSDKLDSLLSHLAPPGYQNDRSVADASAAKRLYFWGFNEKQIGQILRRYRRYEKTERDDYLYEHTIPFATSGSQERITDYYDEDGNYDPDPVGFLPLERLHHLNHDDQRRYAKKRGIEWPSVDEVRNRIRDAIIDSVADGEIAVQSAPTGSGKTHTVATEPWRAQPKVTDEQPVVHAHRTHEARDQARQMSDDAGVDAYTLKGRKELCPVAAGEYDPDNSHGNRAIVVDGEPVSEWLDHRCDRQGIPFSHAHRWLESEVDGELPCQEGDTECAALGQFDGIPRNDNGDPAYDVIHCTHQFLHVPGLRMHTNVFIDEKPSFGIDLTREEINESVNRYLDYVDAPVDSRSELVQAAKSGRDPTVGADSTVEGVMIDEHNESFRERMDQALNGTDTRVECDECGGDGEITDGRGDHHDVTAYPEHGGARASTSCPNCNGTGTVVEARGQPPLEWYRNNPDAHAMAPAFARAIWNAEETAGGRKHARVPYRPPRWGNEQHDEHGWNRVYVDIVLDDQWEVADAEAIPDLSLANSVIGLDAHPQPEDPYWLANVHEDMTTNFSLSQQERTLYRRYERGLHTYQAMEGNQPVGSGEWLDQGQGRKFEAIINQMADHYEDEFDAAITSKTAKARIRSAMEDAGITDPEMMHYGEEESRNDFAGKDVGLVVGSIDPGDDMIVNICARLGLDVDPAYKECPTCEGTGYVEDDDGNDEMCETCGANGEVRERGRTFDGEDAEMADSVLKGVREHHVAQSAGRWARNADDPDDTAEVFILTDAAPDGFIDAKVPGVTWAANEDQRERLEYVRENPDGVTAKELAEATGCSKRTANRDLKRWRENGLVEANPGEGPYGADIYWPGEEFNPAGAVELEAPDGPETAQTPTGTGDVQDTNTYSVSISARPDCAFNTPEEERGEWAYQTALPWYERVSTPPE